MTTTEAPTQVPPRAPARGPLTRAASRLAVEPTAQLAGRILVGVVAVSTLLRIVLVSNVHAPTVFSDELGYAKLALSIGKTGHLALFDDRGLSYSPLYPFVLSPIYALGASAPTAYTLIKIVNAFLISLSIFPAYKISRFVLGRRLSLLVAGLSALVPAMTYSSFTMSENLAYPLCLVAVWATLAAARTPSARNDALLLASIVAASLARLQLVVLLPAALTAILLVALLGPRDGESVPRSVLRSLREHWLLWGIVGGTALVAGAAGLAGVGVFSVGGRYAVVGRTYMPNLSHTVKLFVQHIAGLELGMGVVPFVAALVAAWAFVRSGLRRRELPFAAVAVSLTVWILIETAYDAARFDSPLGDVPRIHERFMIYVVPFFLVALVAAFRAGARASLRVYLVAAAIAIALPATIPYHTMINNTISVDTFGLQPFAYAAGELTAVPHVKLVVVVYAAVLSLLYVRVRTRLRTIVILALVPLVIILSWSRMRIEESSAFGRSFVPHHADWVDRTHPAGGVVLISTRSANTAELETAYSNLSISRVYYLCQPSFGPEFGEQKLTVGAGGRLLTPEGTPLRAARVVMPWSLGVRGRVVTWNGAGGQVVVAPPKAPLAVWPPKKTRDYCDTGAGAGD